MSRKVVLAGACRTAIGTYGGTLSTTPAEVLGSVVIREALKRAKVPPEDVDMVYMGCVIQAGLGQNVARQAAVHGGLPFEVPAVTINAVCGSGLNSVNMAAHMIIAGDADIVVAGGMENMSMAPYALPSARFGYRMGNGELVDLMIKDSLWDAFEDCHMIATADNICRERGLSRQELDEFALASQLKAEAAMKAGKFDAEIVPVTVHKKKETIEFRVDEAPRHGSTIEGLARLKPINPGGFVTAGNAPGINDGAAALVVMSEDKARELGADIMAYWKDGAMAGVRPEIMGIGPVAAVNKIMDKNGLKISDFDVIEGNEAFAAQSVAVGKELEIDVKRQLNPNGGAIALGHPVGASGCRILVTLLHEMVRRDAKKGLATLCIGGGMGCAAAVFR